MVGKLGPNSLDLSLDRFCALLQGRRGAELPYPEGLLAGTGKRGRHVRLSTAADLEGLALRALLTAAGSAQTLAEPTHRPTPSPRREA
jgi:hypothetical protein